MFIYTYIYRSLQSVTRLDLSSNYLEGTLNGELFKIMKSLKYIYLQNNSFSGAIDTGIFPASIEVCNVANNSLNGALTLGFLPNIRYLDLSGNWFTGVKFSDSLNGSYEGNTNFTSIVNLKPNHDTLVCPLYPLVSSTSKFTLYLHEKCELDYASTRAIYILIIIGSIIGPSALFIWFVCFSQERRDTAKSWSRSKYVRWTWFVYRYLFSLYDSFNDVICYWTIIGFIVSDISSADEKCAVSNNIQLIPWTMQAANGVMKVWEMEGLMRLATELTLDSNFTSQVVSFSSVSNASLFLQETDIFQNHNVLDALKYRSQIICELSQCNFVDDLSTGAFSCVSPNPTDGVNYNFLIFVCVSAFVVVVKELVKIIVNLYYFITKREVDIGLFPLVNDGCPLNVLLLFSHSADYFLYKVLLHTPTLFENILVIIIEQLLENASQLVVNTFFALYISEQGVNIFIIWSIASNALKLLWALRRYIHEFKLLIISCVYTKGVYKCTYNIIFYTVQY